MPNRISRLLILPVIFLTILIAAWLLTAEAAPADAIPIESDIPWNEQPGEALTPGQVVSYTFSAEAGQVAALDLIVPEGSLLEGTVTLSKASDGLRVIDDVYGTATDSFGPDDPGGLTAALPETGDYLIEIDPDDFGDGTTGAFIIRFNLVDPASSPTVGQNPDTCNLDTGFVRAAVRAAEAGGVINVCSGHYTESQVIRFGTPNVELRGLGGSYYRPTIESLDDVTLFLQATDLTISGLNLRGGNHGIITSSPSFHPDGLTVDDCRLSGTVSAIRLVPADDVTVKNCVLSVNGGLLDTILIDGDRSHVHNNKINTLTGDEHAHARYGIRLSGDDVHVHDNEIGQLEWPTNTQWAILVSGDRALVEDNEIAGYTHGIRVSADQAITSTAIVRHNHLYGNNVGVSPVGIAVSTVDQAQVSANFISGSPELSAGIRLASSGGQVVNNRVTVREQLALTYEDSFGLHSPASFINNTAVLSQPYPFGIGLYIYSASVPATATLPISATNNLLVAPLTEQDWDLYCGVSASSRLQLLSNNLVAGFDTAFCATAETGSGGIWLAGGESPGLADGELHLADTSPAIDAGTDIGAPPVDFENDARPQNQAIDIGADEKNVPVDLAVLKSGPTIAYPRTDIPYTVEVTNLGPIPAHNVSLDDTFVRPPLDELTVETSQGICQGKRPITCQLGDINPGDSVVISLTVSVTRSWTLENVATVRGDERDENSANNRDELLTEIVDLPDDPFDIFPAALEITQGIQNLDNEVLLVEGKPTMARLYMQTDGETVPDVTALLHGKRDGQPLPGSPLSPLADYAAAPAGPDIPDRNDLGQTVLFELPDSWVEGIATYRVVANPVFPDLETNPDNNELAETIFFYDLPNICMRTYPLRTFATGGGDATIDWEYLLKDPDSMLPRALSLLPVSEFWIYPVNHEIPGEGVDAYDLREVKGDILAYLWHLNLLSTDPAECSQSNARTLYNAMAHEDTNWGTTVGFANRDQLIVKFKVKDDETYNTPLGGRVLAHEVGHNYGRDHVDCRNPDDPDDKYPYDPCTIGPAETDAYFGLDTINLSATAVITPAEAGDLMSYRGDRWTSDYTWHAIGRQLCNRRYGSDTLCLAWRDATPSASQPAAIPTSSDPLTATFPFEGDLLLISGWITNTITISGTQQLPPGIMPEEKVDELWQQQQELIADGSPYELQLLDLDDTLLYTQTISATVVADGDGSAFFGLVAPSVAGTTRVRISDQGSPVVTQTASAHAPTVTVLAPNGGETITDTLTVAWSAADADGDPLSYMVRYSADNGTSWQVLANELYTTSLTIDTAVLPGSDGDSLVQVLANDGFHTAHDTSNFAFSLESHAPLVNIQKPSDGALFDTGAPIALKGQAFDPEDGHLTGDSLTWQLEGHGVVGAGRQATIFGLPAGDYQLTLIASDADGQTGTASVSIKVLPGGRTNVFLPLLSQ